jgi:hypothetical protein
MKEFKFKEATSVRFEATLDIAPLQTHSISRDLRFSAREEAKEIFAPKCRLVVRGIRVKGTPREAGMKHVQTRGETFLYGVN